LADFAIRGTAAETAFG
jgi:hypothetical protein